MDLDVDKNLLEINGLGRIGKSTLWYHINENYFDGFIINVGRPLGKNLEDIAHFIVTDSTYGLIEKFLYGVEGKKEIKIINEDENLLEVFGKPVKILCKARNPKDIEWQKKTESKL